MHVILIVVDKRQRKRIVSSDSRVTIKWQHEVYKLGRNNKRPPSSGKNLMTQDALMLLVITRDSCKTLLNQLKRSRDL